MKKEYGELAEYLGAGLIGLVIWGIIGSSYGMIGFIFCGSLGFIGCVASFHRSITKGT